MILALAMSLVGGSIACGKKGPPSPPIRVTPVAPGPVRARQVGTDIILSATVQGRRTDGSALADGSEIHVLRMPATAALRPGAVSERYLVQQFVRQARVLTVVSGDPLRQAMKAGRLQFVDTGAATAPQGAEGAMERMAFLYGMQIFAPGGERSPVRPPVLVEIGVPPSPPGALRAEADEGEIRLEWEAPTSGAAAYNVYRRLVEDTQEPDKPLNPAPVEKPEYADRTFRYDTAYVYFVRTVDRGRATPCESAAGPPVEIRPHDHFPPVAPTGIAVTVEGGQIRVYWFPNAEPDLAGYLVYRRTDEQVEASRVGEVAAGESAFVDPGAVPGVRYHYSVSAIDDATPPNESPRSEERAERLPRAIPGTEAKPGGAGEAD